MGSVWIFLTGFMDVYPWMLLQYLPFRRRLRFSYGKTLLVCSAVLIAWQIGFVCLAAQPFCTLNRMLAYRIAQLFLLEGLTCVMIRSPFAQSFFVVCLMFPCVMLTLTAACFLLNFLPVKELPAYMAASLLRLALSAALLPFMLWFFKWVLIPIMDVQDEGVWRYAWPIPASFTLVSLAYTKNDFELVGVGLRELVGRLFLFGGVLAACLLLFKMIKQAQMRIRAAEEAKKSKLLLAVEAEQYRALTDGIERARRARHDLRQHLSVLSALSERSDPAELRRYLSRLAETIPAERAPLLCENPAANAVLRHYLARAEAEDAAATIAADIPAGIGIEDTDLAILLGNLFENALEACAYLPADARFIHVRARKQGSRLFFILSNACDAEAERSESGALSRKRGYREAGVGLMSVRAVAEKYEGEMQINQERDRFTVSVMLREKTGAARG